MSRKLIIAFTYLIVLFSCTSDKPEIRAVSELTSDGGHFIKWETYPPIQGKVDIYYSYSPEQFDRNQPPLMSEDIAQGYTKLPSLSKTQRPYFELVFNKQHRIIASERIVPMQVLFNFRDLGGYHNRENKQLKWGQIYRSSSLGRANEHDKNRVSQLGIKTVVDLRVASYFEDYPPLCEVENIYHFPLRGNRYNFFFDQVLAGQLRRSDIIKHLQEVFYSTLEENTDYLAQIFDVLLDKDNYPIVIACSLGKDRSAILATLVLAALDVNDNTIISDYLLSNELIDYHSQAQDASLFGPEIQQNLTALFSAHRETIAYTLEKIKEQYGSLNAYMEKELNLTSDKRARLKEILLYP